MCVCGDVFSNGDPTVLLSCLHIKEQQKSLLYESTRGRKVSECFSVFYRSHIDIDIDCIYPIDVLSLTYIQATSSRVYHAVPRPCMCSVSRGRKLPQVLKCLGVHLMLTMPNSGARIHNIMSFYCWKCKRGLFRCSEGNTAQWMRA